MARPWIILFPLLVMLIGSMACKTDDTIVSDAGSVGNNADHGNNTNDTTANRLKIRVGSRTFRAILLANATVTAFKARLPLTVSMSELHGNEKLYRFSNDLPTNASNPGTIHTGDLMIYSSNTLVLFYQTFPTSYRYTKLGRIDNPAGLATALGTGSVTVTFELEGSE